MPLQQVLRHWACRADSTGGAPPVDSSWAGMVLHGNNSSSHDLQCVGGFNPASALLVIIPAGGTDRIVWHGTNLELEPTWQVVGTECNVFPELSVPLIGENGDICAMDDVSHDSPLGMSHCDIHCERSCGESAVVGGCFPVDGKCGRQSAATVLAWIASSTVLIPETCAMVWEELLGQVEHYRNLLSTFPGSVPRRLGRWTRLRRRRVRFPAVVAGE